MLFWRGCLHEHEYEIHQITYEHILPCSYSYMNADLFGNIDIRSF